jgi:hypothetical protein
MQTSLRRIFTALTLVFVAALATPAAPLLSAPSSTIEGTQASGQFGASVANAGDTNDDGYDDLIVGKPSYGEYGAALVFLGGPGGITSVDPSSASTVIEGTSAYSIFGRVVAGAGDTNNDGYDDVIVSGTSDVYVFLGGPAGIASGDSSTATATIHAEDGFQYFGDSIAGVGDVNGDGYDDVMVGGQKFTQVGVALLYLGGSQGIVGGGPASASAVLQSVIWTWYGWIVAGAGDVNADGYDDVLIGGWENRVLLFKGGPGGIASGNETTASAALTSDQSYADFGRAVASAGDVNGDGYDDILVGAYYYDGKRGAAFVFLGGPNGIASGNARTASTILHSNRVGDIGFGEAVAGVGDVNGDGYDDVLVRAYNSNAWNAHTVFLYLGGTAGGISRWADSIADFSADAVVPSGAGDFNADGFDDVVLGDPSYDVGAGDEGRALVYLGRPDDRRLFDYDYNEQWARTAEISSAYDYGVWQDYPTGFARWTHVAGGARYLFFYNAANGEAALGSVDSTGAFTQLRYFPPGTSFGVGWTHIVWHGDELFLYASSNGLAAVGRFDGADFAFHQYNTFQYLISGWTQVVSVQGYLLFYKAGTGGAYACQLNPVYNTSTGVLTQINFQYVRVQTFSTGWTHIVDSRNGVLFYNAANGGYRIGDFDRAGYFTNRVAPWPPWSAFPLWHYTTQRAGWTQVTAAGGRLLFYDKNTGEGVTAYVRTAAQSEAEQAEPLAIVQTYPWGSLSHPAAMKWSHVVPVAAQ